MTCNAPSLRRDRRCDRAGFTLVELLVVVAIVAVLVSILLPALATGRTAARIVKAHAELRSIEIALQLYQDDNAGALPPTRFSCAMRTAYELPMELASGMYLPRQDKYVQTAAGDGFVDAVQMYDVFAPQETYKYRAVGPAIMNEFTVLEPPNGSSLWVPDDFPNSRSTTGKYYRVPRESPVRFALWSVGPDPKAAKLQHIPGRLPLPQEYWCRGARDAGVITHFQSPLGRMYQSP